MLKGTARVVLLILILVLVMLAALTFSYEKPVHISGKWAGRHILVDDVRLRVYQAGQGPDVLFIHGSIGSLEDFETVTPELARRYRVTSFDRVGHGFSEMADTAADIALNAYYTRLLIETLGLQNVIVVGHSYGGSVALKLALEDTHSIKGYVLLAPAAYPLDNTRLLEHLLATDIIGLGLIRTLRPWLAEDMLQSGLLRSLTPNQDVVPADFISSRLKLWNNPGVLYTRTQQTAHVNRELKQMATLYKTINKPVVILLGRQEPHSDISTGSVQLSQELPNARLQLLDETGHYIQYKQPTAVISAIRMLR